MGSEKRKVTAFTWVIDTRASHEPIMYTGSRGKVYADSTFLLRESTGVINISPTCKPVFYIYIYTYIDRLQIPIPQFRFMHSLML